MRGMVSGTAVSGKEGQKVGDSLEGFRADLPETLLLEQVRHPLQDPGRVLGNATTRLIYDVFAYERTRERSQPEAAVSYTLTRETHVSDLAPGERTKIQHSFSYSDGFGREIQKKMQAEPGWLVAGGPVVSSALGGQRMDGLQQQGKACPSVRTILYGDAGVRICGEGGGVSDPFLRSRRAGRRDALPEPHFRKGSLRPVAPGDLGRERHGSRRSTRRTGTSVISSRAFRRRTIRQPGTRERESGALGQAQQDAAKKAARHEKTPSLSYADSLGRTFLSIAHNRVEREAQWRDEFYATRSVLDIQGNQRAVVDAFGRVIARYTYDVTGRRMHENSADAGLSWVLNDALSKVVLAFDNRGHRFRREYDALRRPTTLFVRIGDAARSLSSARNTAKSRRRREP